MPPSASAVFVSYSHQDKTWLEDLLTMLSPVVRSGAVQVWSDGEIEPSDLSRRVTPSLADSRTTAWLPS
jgi:hypothetical protein